MCEKKMTKNDEKQNKKNLYIWGWIKKKKGNYKKEKVKKSKILGFINTWSDDMIASTVCHVDVQ